MSDGLGTGSVRKYQELKRLLLQYSAFLSDLPVKPGRGADLGPPFEKCVLEARFVFPGLSPDEQEQIALLRLAGINILGRQLMTRLSADRLGRHGLRIEDKEELTRITAALEADFLECKAQIVNRGTPERLTEVQRMFWEEWSNPLDTPPAHSECSTA